MRAVVKFEFLPFVSAHLMKRQRIYSFYVPQAGGELRNLHDLVIVIRVAGMLVIEGDRGVIGYNSTHALVRQRFTIAHEISHYLLDTKKNQKSQLWTVAGVWAAMWTFEPKLPDCRFITPTSLWNIVIVKSSGLGTDA